MNPNIGNEGKKTRFKPGQSGNSAGRPRRKRIVHLLTAIVELPLSPEALKLVRPGLRADLPEGVTYGDLLEISITLRGIDKADVASFKEIRSCEMSLAEIMDSNEKAGKRL